MAGLGYLDTETKDFLSVDGVDANGNLIITDLSGTELVLSPKLSYYGLFRVFYPLAGGEISAQVDFSHKDEWFFDSNNSPHSVGGNYTIWNARIAWRTEDEKIEVAAFVRNLTEEEYFSDGFDVFGSQGLVPNTPRTTGISVSYFY
jgi:iron complex outermembrane receptor protein